MNIIIRYFINGFVITTEEIMLNLISAILVRCLSHYEKSIEEISIVFIMIHRGPVSCSVATAQRL